MKKGFAPILILIAIFIVSGISLTSFKILMHSKLAVAPTSVPKVLGDVVLPSPTSTLSPHTTTVPVNGNFEVNNGNTHIKIQSSGGRSIVKVSTSGNGSADVSVHEHIDQTVTYSTSTSGN